MRLLIEMYLYKYIQSVCVSPVGKATALRHMNSCEFIIGVFTLRIDELMLLFSQQNVSLFSFKSVIFIIHHVTRGANGSGWSLCACIDFRTLWVKTPILVGG